MIRSILSAAYSPCLKEFKLELLSYITSYLRNIPGGKDFRVLPGRAILGNLARSVE